MEPKIDSTIEALNKCKKTAPNGEDYWMARDLQVVLAYANWQGFEGAINRARTACDTSGVNSEYQFIHINKGMKNSTGAQIEREDYYLSRYACYLVTMNGDPSKPEIASAQTYFAMQTRLQELETEQLNHGKRIELRERVKMANKSLFGAAQKAGVTKFGPFNNAGYQGLYGMGLPEIKARKQIPATEDLLDCAGRTELAANEFRITQTEQFLTRKNVQRQEVAIQTHRHVGEQVRETIKKLGGTMPEDLPKESSIKKIIAEGKKKIKQLPPIPPSQNKE